MDGQGMLGGLQGFQQGWRFGRELVEGDELDRKNAAALKVAQEEAAAKAMAEQYKAALEQYKEEGRNSRAGMTEEGKDRRAAVTAAGAAESRRLQRDQFGQTLRAYDEGADMRDAQYENEVLRNQEAALSLQKQQQDLEFVRRNQQDMMDFQKYQRGELDPESAKRWDVMLGIAATDPRPARAALESILPKSQALFKQGRLDEVQRMWASDEGKAALSAWAPAYKSVVGNTVEGGKYVIQDVNPNRMEFGPNGKGAAMILDVSIAPSKEFAAQLQAELAQAKTPEEKARIQYQLQPSTYQAPLTDGRVPVAEGGNAKIFTPEEFAQGISSLDKRIAVFNKNPEMVERLKRRLLARASGTGISDTFKAEAKLESEFMREQATKIDQELRAQGLSLQEKRLNAKGAGKDESLQIIRMKQGSVDKATQLPKEWDAENGVWKTDPDQVRHRNAVNARAKDIIAANPMISITDAIKQASDEVPLPKGEVDKQLDAIVSRRSAPAAEQPMSPTGNIDGMKVRNPTTGEVVIFRNGRWVPE